MPHLALALASFFLQGTPGHRAETLVRELDLDGVSTGVVVGDALIVENATTGLLQRVSLRSGAVVDLGVGGSLHPRGNWEQYDPWIAPTLGGGALVLVSSESQFSVDWNGDGDTSDSVPRFYDPRSGVVESSGLALWAGGVKLGRDRVAFAVDETHQGSDLNGDGDLDDRILHTWTPGEAPRSLGIYRGHVLICGAHVLFGLSESDYGVLNGDGDTRDLVLHLYDADAMTTTNLGLALDDDFIGSDDMVVFLVREADQGVDLNADGDLGDEVVHFYAPEHGLLNTRLPGGPPAMGYFEPPVAKIRGEWIVFYVSETNVDLDGDGDTSGFVLHAHRRGTSTFQNLGIRLGEWIDATTDFAAFVRSEAAYDTDWNGDGDLLDDVLFYRRFDSPVARNTGLPLIHSAGHGDFLAFQVDEAAQGGIDRNGDGDAQDHVFALLDTRTGEVHNTRWAGDATIYATTRVTDSGSVGVLVSEEAQGRDLNRDGDREDHLLGVYDVQWPRSLATLPAHVWSPARHQDGVWLHRVSESVLGDLNGDGDTADLRLRVLVPGPRRP
jgi:hypothetical protein